MGGRAKRCLEALCSGCSPCGPMPTMPQNHKPRDTCGSSSALCWASCQNPWSSPCHLSYCSWTTGLSDASKRRFVWGSRADTEYQALPLSRLISEKIPLFALVAFSCLITLFAQWKGGALKPLGKLPLEMKAANAAVSLCRLPLEDDLAQGPGHPISHPLGLPLWQVAGALSLLVVITVFGFLARRKYPCLVTGWLWYIERSCSHWIRAGWNPGNGRSVYLYPFIVFVHSWSLTVFLISEQDIACEGSSFQSAGSSVLWALVLSTRSQAHPLGE